MLKYRDPQQAIDAAGHALEKNGFPWYDAATDSLRRVDVRPPDSGDMPGASANWNFLIYAVAIIVLTLALIALIASIVRALKLRKASRKSQGKSPATGDAERIAALPTAVARGKLSLLDQARTFYEAGDYAKATIYLYSHQLVQLDRHQVIRLAKGKTNRQYLREVGGANALRQLVGQTLVAFEDVFFGHHAMDRGRFESCWTRVPEFESLVARGTRSA